MTDPIFKISNLPDLSMPKYRARFGANCQAGAREALFRVLQLLQPDASEWLVLRYLYAPSASLPQDRLRLFVRTHAETNSDKGIPGFHLISEFYQGDQATAEEALASLTTAQTPIFLVRKDQELMIDKSRDLLFYVPVDFSVEASNPVEPHQLDSLFASLTAPCAVDVSLKPSYLSPAEKSELIEEIQELDRLASGFESERPDAGDITTLSRPRELVAIRHRDIYQQYFDGMFSERIYEFSVRVLSADPREGDLVANSLGRAFIPDGRFRVAKREASEPQYANIREAIQAFEHHTEVFQLPNGVKTWSEQFAQRASRVVETLEKRVNRAARLSHFCSLVSADMAARFLQLPTSDGVYLQTIRIESEVRALKGAAPSGTPQIEIGPETDRGSNANVGLDQLQKHAFVAGVTGSGKTTSIHNVLIQLWEKHGIPFLVLEPAKSEYRILAQSKGKLANDLRIYSPGNERLSPFRFNPLEVPAGVTVEEHISALETCFTGAIPMAGPLPSLISEAIVEAYCVAGFRLSDDEAKGRQWPTMKKLVDAANQIMAQRGYVGEVKANLQTAIDVRLKSLAQRSVGRMFSFDRSFPSIEELLQYPTIFEMDSLNLDQQNLLILFLLTSIRERLGKLGPSKTLRHIVVLEEAHNLIGIQSGIGQPSEDFADPRGHATRFLIKMLAEIRAYGIGIIVADQSPAAIAPEVLKNTSVKLLHRTVSEDDRNALAASMLMDRFAHEELARLYRGEAYLYHEHLYRPGRVTSLYPTADLERPDDNQLLAILGKTQWFQCAQDARFEHFQAQLDGLYHSLFQLLDRYIKWSRVERRSDEFRQLHERISSYVKMVREKLNDKIADAMLDRSMATHFEKRGRIYAAKIQPLITEAQEQMRKEDLRGKKKQKRVAGKA